MVNKMVLTFLIVGIVCITAVNSENVRKYDGYSVIRINAKTESQLKYLKDLQNDILDLNFWKFGPDGNVDIMVPPHLNQTFQKTIRDKNFVMQTLIDDVGKLAAEEKVAPLGSSPRLTFDRYYRLADIHAFLNEIAANNPSLARVETVGKSYENRNIQVIKIGVGVANNNKPIIIIDCGVHAREWVSPAFCTFVIQSLVDKYKANDADVVQLLNKFDFYILPSTNPDGYEYTHTNDRMWRKTRRPNPGSTCVGTDPNRNWGFGWGGAGTSTNPCSEVFKGPNAFSESETKAVSDYMLGQGGRIKSYFAVHSYGQYWIYPWSYIKDVTKDDADLNAMGKLSTDTLRALYGTVYTYGTVSSQISQDAGSQEDWAYGSCGVKYSFCIELRDKGRYGFQLPADQIVDTSTEAMAGIIVHAKTAAFELGL